MRYLRQGTAATVAVGPFVGSDGLTAVTSLTTSTCAGRAYRAGVAAAYTPGSFVHDTGGVYLAAVAQADVPSAGPLRVLFHPSGACPVWEDFTVLAPAVYDALFGTVALSTFAPTADAPVTVGGYTASAGLGLITPCVVAASPSPTTLGFAATAADGSPLESGVGWYVNATRPYYVLFSGGRMRGLRFPITAYAGGAFTVSGMPVAPAAGDTFNVMS